MKKIAVDAFLNKNLGDDLFIYLLLDRYKNEDVEFVIDVYNHEYEEIFKDYKNIKVQKRGFFRRVLIRLPFTRKLVYKSESAKYDGFLVIGGSMFMQVGPWEEQLRRFSERIEQYKNKKKDIFIVGSNFGPYTDDRFLESYKKVFSNCTDVCLRDKYSYDKFSDCSNVRLGSDVVFCLDKKVEKNENTTGISVIDVSHREELKDKRDAYISKMVEVVNYLSSKGEKILLFSFCEMQGDLNTANEIYNKSDCKENIEIINYTGDIEGYIEKLGSVEQVIGSRFHSIILSQVFGQDVYPLIYSDKITNILKDMKLDENYKYITEIDDVSPEELCEKIRFNKVSDMTDIRRQAELQFKNLDKFIGWGKENED